MWSQTFVFHHNQESGAFRKKENISSQRKCIFFSFGMDPQLVTLYVWPAGSWMYGGGSLGLDPSPHMNLDVMSAISAWRPSMGPQDSS